MGPSATLAAYRYAVCHITYAVTRPLEDIYLFAVRVASNHLTEQQQQFRRDMCGSAAVSLAFGARLPLQGITDIEMLDRRLCQTFV